MAALEPPAGPDQVDAWLEDSFGAELTAVDRAYAHGVEGADYAAFRGLGDDVWAVLLTQQYTRYPHIKAFLPDVPAADLQELWNGRSGVHLAAQSSAFLRALRATYALHGARSLSEATVLDFGCGWGRLLRHLARVVAPADLYGCDPHEGILDLCRTTRVPGTLALSSFLPDRLPFDARFDLIYAFSVFTHLSERAHRACLSAFARSMAPGAVLVLTVRPPSFADICEPLAAATDEAGYRFAPHHGLPGAAELWGEHDSDFGDTIITLDHIRRRWAPDFELLAADPVPTDPYQLMLTLRRT